MDDEEVGTHSSAAAGLGKSHPAVEVIKTQVSYSSLNRPLSLDNFLAPERVSGTYAGPGTF